jgi:hypothetical protein
VWWLLLCGVVVVVNNVVDVGGVVDVASHDMFQYVRKHMYVVSIQMMPTPNKYETYILRHGDVYGSTNI